MAISIPLKQKYRVNRSKSGGVAKSRTGSAGGRKKVKATAGQGPRRKAYGPF